MRTIITIRALGVGAAVSLMITSCSLLVDNEVNAGCESNSDCQSAGLGPAFACLDGICVDATWSCLGNVPVPPAGSGTRLWRQRYVEITTQLPPPDLQVDLCQNTDISCMNPIAIGLTPGSDGVVANPVPYAFEGYAVVTSAFIEPAVVHFPRPVVNDIDDQTLETFNLLPLGTTSTFAAELGVPLDPARTVLITVSLDCTGAPADGTVVETDTGDMSTITLYINNRLPDPSLRETRKSGNGNAVTLNHPVGLTTLRISRVETEETTGTRQLFLRGRVRNTSFTNYIALPPTP